VWGAIGDPAGIEIVHRRGVTVEEFYRAFGDTNRTW
jgi:hypothetical protein